MTSRQVVGLVLVATLCIMVATALGGAAACLAIAVACVFSARLGARYLAGRRRDVPRL